MRKIALYLLILVGILEIYLGMLAGGLRIYAMEMPFAHAIGLNSLSKEEQKAFWYYIHHFENGWVIVAWLGAIIIALAYTGLRSLRSPGPQQKLNQAEQITPADSHQPHKLNP